MVVITTLLSDLHSPTSGNYSALHITVNCSWTLCVLMTFKVKLDINVGRSLIIYIRQFLPKTSV